MGRGVIAALVAMGALLFVSLGFNVFTLGHMSGRMIAGHPPQEKSERGSRGGFEDPFRILTYADELSPELRERFREAFREELPTLREEHHNMKGLRRELGVLMSAEVWDREAIAAKLDEISAAQERKYDVFNEAFLSAFESLPAAERKRLIDTANQRRAEHHKKRRKDRGDEHRDPPPPVEGEE
ncbi:periplasmic heavy metal sensor [Hyphococcus sp.]|uniref:periplasmic heavy metal sensor n=1 Tax=Hyphococcus sp. TaxID=2038636 RepID=UPI0020820627|nr:MAG: hypothetical protein DHS20C04_24580 [Marinicaulis sp.]